MSTLAPAPADRDLRRAWISVALIPVFFLLAFVVGEGLYSALGYDASQGDEPLWVLLLVAVVALPVFLAPCAAAVVYGRRARRAGNRQGVVPLVIGGAVGGWFLVLNAVGLVAALVR